MNGDWDKVIAANTNAVAADEYWLKNCPSVTSPACNQQLVGHYRSHDLLFLTVGLSNRGNWPLVEASAKATEDNTARFVDGERGLEHYLTTRVMMATRFAQWDYILNLDPPQKDLPAPPAEGDLAGQLSYCTAMKYPLATALHYFGRTMALSARKAAKEEIAENFFLYQRAEDCARKGAGWGNNTAAAVLDVVHYRLDARLAQSENNPEEAVLLAGEAVQKEDAMNYDEPPGWYVSSRESYGAALYRWGNSMPAGARRTQILQQALDVFQRDLQLHRNSSRSLFGVWKCYEAMGKPTKDIADAKAKFLAEWKTNPPPSMDNL